MKEITLKKEKKILITSFYSKVNNTKKITSFKMKTLVPKMISPDSNITAFKTSVDTIPSAIPVI